MIEIFNSDIPSTGAEEVVCLFIDFLCSMIKVLGNLLVDTICVLRHMFMEGKAAGDVRNLLSLPLSELGFILFDYGHLLHHVLLRELDPFLVVGDIEDVQLLRIPILSVNCLNVVLARFEGGVMNARANLANENTMLQFKVS